MKDTYTVAEMAEKSGLHPETIREAIRIGTLPHRRGGANGNALLVPCKEFTAWLKGKQLLRHGTHEKAQEPHCA